MGISAGRTEATHSNNTTTTALDGVEVECTHCGIRMSMHLGSSQRIRYFRCASCHRWVSSAYTEVFRADTKLRTHAIQPDDESGPRFDAVKDRLERWLASLDNQDPYRCLGIAPMDSPEKIRARYRELALEHHPDRGGSEGKMRELNSAYERIIHHRERKASESLTSGTSVSASSLPDSSR